VLRFNETSLTLYLPKARWYSWWTLLEEGKVGEVTLSTPIDMIQLHLRGGGIIPLQTPNMTTNLQRRNPYQILVALNENFQAYGSLYLDDGINLEGKSALQVEYSCLNSTLTALVVQTTYPLAETLQYSDVIVLGLNSTVRNVVANGVSVRFYYNITSSVLNVTSLGLPLSENLKIYWE